MKYLNLWSLIGLSVRSDKSAFDCAAIATAVASAASKDIHCDAIRDDREIFSLSLCIDFAFQSTIAAVYRDSRTFRRMWRVSDAPFAGDSRRFRVAFAAIGRWEAPALWQPFHFGHFFNWEFYFYFGRVDFIGSFRFVFVSQANCIIQCFCVRFVSNCCRNSDNRINKEEFLPCPFHSRHISDFVSRYFSLASSSSVGCALACGIVINDEHHGWANRFRY